MNDVKTQLRQLAIHLLDNGDGITEEAYQSLQTLEATIANGSCDDIFLAVRGVEGHYFLHENHGFTA
jgi:hypothetical protein